MQFDERPAQVQAQSGSINAPRPGVVGAKETTKDVRLLALGNADALVMDGKDDHLSIGAFRDSQQNLACVRAIFHRVAEEIGEDALDALHIKSADDMARCGLQRDRMTPGPGLYSCHYPLRQGHQISVAAVYLQYPRPQSGDIE